MKMTIKEIAKMANVTSTTVSRVINNKPDVKPETRELILELIKEYNFQPNAFAKAISSQKSNCVALVIPHKVSFVLMNPYYAEVIRGISGEFNKKGYFLLFYYINQTDDLHQDYVVNIFKQKRVDGFILLSPGKSSQRAVESLKKFGAPFVSTSKMLQQPDIVYVDIDNYLGASLATEHLISLGHQKIAFIKNGFGILASSEERFNGYRDTLLKNNIPYDEGLVELGDTSLKSGYIAMNRLLDNKTKPTAVFVAADMMAIGVIRAIRERELRIPEDISIIGFDDIPEAEFMNPPLTTIRQPAFEKGKKAANLIINMLDRKIPGKPVLLDVELVVRSSTSVPANSK